MPTFQRDGIKLSYATRGEGPPLLFINGLCGDRLYWNGQVRAFSKRFQCIAVDNRDVGQSSALPKSYGIADLAEDWLALLRHLRLPAAHVVGLSMGGMIAQEMAIIAPELVKSLILLATAVRSDDWFCGTLSAFEVIRRNVPDTAAFFDAIMPWWVSHRFFENAERVAWLRWILRQNPDPQSLQGFVRQLDAIRQYDARDRAGRIRCPTAVLVGEDDSVLPPRYSRELCEAVPQAKLVVLAGVGHGAPVEDPGQLNARISEFLESV